MKYTKYLSGIIKHQGIPHVGPLQYARLMNIVSLEGRLQELMDIKEKTGTGAFDVRIIGLKDKIKELTYNLEPKELLQRLIEQSEL